MKYNTNLNNLFPKSPTQTNSKVPIRIFYVNAFLHFQKNLLGHLLVGNSCRDFKTTKEDLFMLCLSCWFLVSFENHDWTFFSFWILLRICKSKTWWMSNNANNCYSDCKNPFSKIGKVFSAIFMLVITDALAIVILFYGNGWFYTFLQSTVER